MKNDNLRLAVQKDGRLTEDSLDLLKASGFVFSRYDHTLISPCSNFPLEIIYVRDDDIPRYVEEGTVDLGIIGENVLFEKKYKVEKLLPLGFGACNLVIGVPKNSKIQDINGLKGKKIATSYSASVKEFFKKKNVNVGIINISGAVEIAPIIGVADAIADLVATGVSMKMNDLRPIETIFKSEVVLVANPQSLKNKQKKELINMMLIMTKGVLSAGRYKYIVMNLPKVAVPKIQALIPGLKSPTVVPLVDENWVAVHVVIKEELFWEIVDKMKQAGAQGIVVIPTEKLII